MPFSLPSFRAFSFKKEGEKVDILAASGSNQEPVELVLAQAPLADTPSIVEPSAPSEAEKKRLKKRGQGGLARDVSVFDLVQATAKNSLEVSVFVYFSLYLFQASEIFKEYKINNVGDLELAGEEVWVKLKIAIPDTAARLYSVIHIPEEWRKRILIGHEMAKY